jgi:isocitrate/isopropylmalate dehydrogenase
MTAHPVTLIRGDGIGPELAAVQRSITPCSNSRPMPRRCAPSAM